MIVYNHFQWILEDFAMAIYQDMMKGSSRSRSGHKAYLSFIHHSFTSSLQLRNQKWVMTTFFLCCEAQGALRECLQDSPHTPALQRVRGKQPLHPEAHCCSCPTPAKTYWQEFWNQCSRQRFFGKKQIYVQVHQFLWKRMSAAPLGPNLELTHLTFYTRVTQSLEAEDIVYSTSAQHSEMDTNIRPTVRGYNWVFYFLA